MDNFQSIFKNFKLKILTLLIILILVIYNLFFSKNPFAAGYKIIKIVEFGALIIYISAQGRSALGGNNIVKILSLSVIWQSVLAIIQWLKQGSIFGYWFFGEQPFNTATHGIKLISWFGEMKVVPMGTFPHPNVLAGFLVISLIVIVHYLARGRVSNNALLEKYILLTACILGSISLFLTFSFPAWLVLVFSILYLVFRKLRKKVTGSLNYWVIELLGYCIIGLLLIALAIKFIDPTSLSRRIQLSQIAIKMWLSSPIFGVGLNNFIPRMEEFGQVVSNIRFLQPVHNIYLLTLAETGIVGFILVFGILYLVFRKLKKKVTGLCRLCRACSTNRSALGYCVIGLLFLGFFDHYFFTIQQGILMTSVILGLSLGKKQKVTF